jgi:hypothetical protein
MGRSMLLGLLVVIALFSGGAGVHSQENQAVSPTADVTSIRMPAVSLNYRLRNVAVEKVVEIVIELLAKRGGDSGRRNPQSAVGNIQCC